MQVTTVTFGGNEYTSRIIETADDAKQFEQWITWLTRDGFTLLGLDCETTGLEPHGPEWKLTLVQFSDGNEIVVVVVNDDTRAALVTALSNPRVKVATHSQIDRIFLHYGIGVDLGERVLDTHSMSLLLYPGKIEKHGLKFLVEKDLGCHELTDAEAALHAEFQRMARAEGNNRLAVAKNKLQTWGWKTIEPTNPVLLTYAGLDALATRKLADVYGMRLSSNPELLVREQWLATLATDMRLRGIKVDTHHLDHLLQSTEAAWDQTKTDLEELIGMPAMSPRRVEWLRNHGVEFDPFYTTDKGAVSLSADHIKVLAEKHTSGEAGRALALMVKVSNLKNQLANLRTFVEYTFDGRTFPEIKTQEAHTGRMSIVRPALQTLKKGDPTLRGCFMADDGMALVSCDFSQIEIRVAAALSADPTLTDLILEGKDMHDATAASVFGPDFTKEQRQIAKTANFGSLFGGGAKTLARQAKITLDEARHVSQGWRTTYKGITALSQALAQRSEVVNVAGRRIPLDPERRYAGLNYAIQSTAREILVCAIYRIANDLGLRDSLWLFVHDEVLLQVPEAQAAEVAAAVKQAMTFTFYGVPIEADAEVLGKFWASEKESPLAA